MVNGDNKVLDKKAGSNKNTKYKTISTITIMQVIATILYFYNYTNN